MEVRFEPARCDRPSRGLAVLARIPGAGRSAGPAGLSDGLLSQVGALFPCHAFAVGRALQRAPRAVRLGAGHFFGEVAALRRTRRSATVTAVTRTSLLMLDAHDLHVLMDREPRIAERIREVARSRLGGDSIAPKGDLVVEELEDADAVKRSAPRHGSS